MLRIAIWSALLTASAMQSAQASEVATSPTSYERATPALRTYCLETVCLGMTIQEVHALGRLLWESERLPSGAIACTMTGAKHNKAVGGFSSKAGTEFQVGFEPVGRSGNASERYRLTFIEAKLPDVLASQVEETFKAVLSRYEPMQKLEGRTYGTGTPDEQFNVYFTQTTAAEQPPGYPARIAMLAEYRFKAPWLASLPECKAKVPRL